MRQHASMPWSSMPACHVAACEHVSMPCSILRNTPSSIPCTRDVQHAVQQIAEHTVQRAVHTVHHTTKADGAAYREAYREACHATCHATYVMRAAYCAACSPKTLQHTVQNIIPRRRTASLVVPYASPTQIPRNIQPPTNDATRAMDWSSGVHWQYSAREADAGLHAHLIGVMVVIVDANFSQIARDSGCLQGFMDRMLKQQLHTIERYGIVSTSEREIQTVIDAAKADSAEIADMGENKGVHATTLACVPHIHGHGRLFVRAWHPRCRTV